MDISPHQKRDQAYIDRESVARALNSVAHRLARADHAIAGDAQKVASLASAVLDLTQALEIIDRESRRPPTVGGWND